MKIADRTVSLPSRRFVLSWAYISIRERITSMRRSSHSSFLSADLRFAAAHLRYSRVVSVFFEGLSDEIIVSMIGNCPCTIDSSVSNSDRLPDISSILTESGSRSIFFSSASIISLSLAAFLQAVKRQAHHQGRDNPCSTVIRKQVK